MAEKATLPVVTFSAEVAVAKRLPSCPKGSRRRRQAQINPVNPFEVPDGYGAYCLLLIAYCRRPKAALQTAFDPADLGETARPIRRDDPVRVGLEDDPEVLVRFIYRHEGEVFTIGDVLVG